MGAARSERPTGWNRAEKPPAHPCGAPAARVSRLVEPAVVAQHVPELKAAGRLVEVGALEHRALPARVRRSLAGARVERALAHLVDDRLHVVRAARGRQDVGALDLGGALLAGLRLPAA